MCGAGRGAGGNTVFPSCYAGCRISLLVYGRGGVTCRPALELRMSLGLKASDPPKRKWSARASDEAEGGRGAAGFSGEHWRYFMQPNQSNASGRQDLFGGTILF